MSARVPIARPLLPEHISRDFARFKGSRLLPSAITKRFVHRRKISSNRPRMAAAVQKDDLFIPLIDFSAFLHGSPQDKAETAAEILSGFQKAGFIYLKNHGIPAAAISEAFAESAKWFSRPQAEKDALAWYSPKANRGYTAHGREKVTNLAEKEMVDALRNAVPDLKESFEIGREGEPDCPNLWFEGEEGQVFKRKMLAFHDSCRELYIKLMQAIACGLGIEEHWFDSFTGGGDNTLRLLHYPPVKKSVFEANKAQVRAGAHTDYGSVTLLFQDDRGGLQVESPNGTFIDATPIPDTIVINAGDLLARWSNDTIKSTTHRVVEPPMPPEAKAGNEYPARYSIAYFCNPNFNRLIETIPSTYEAGVKPKYDPINSGEYLETRIAATY